MKKIASSALILIMLLTLSGCGKGKKTSAPVQGDTAVNVSVFETKKKTIEDTVTYTGEIKASAAASISAKASGVAKAVYKEIGDFVSEGDILLIIDDTDYRTQYNQASAAYEAARAQYNSITNGGAQQTKLQLEAALNSAKIEYNNAKSNYENQKVLYENGAISKSAYDAAVTRYDNAQINFNTAQSNYDLTIGVVLEENKTSAKASLNSAKVTLEAASNALENTVVRAPISGYIAGRNANKGQMVAQGVEVFSIKATELVEAKINVTEAVISKISLGTKATIGVKAANAENIEGSVTTLSPTKNAQTGMYQVGITIDNFDGILKDGMFADVKLALSVSEKALVIPSEAVLEDEDGKKYVFVADKNTAKRTNIETGIITDEYTQIVKGVKEGDKVVVSGQDYLSEKNNKIKIVK